MSGIEHLKEFPVIEFRRYLIKREERSYFARCFESYFPEAFEQLGSLIFGQFFERGNPQRFTWIRGFHNLEERATVNKAFYEGPLWREHANTMNERILDHTNVLLLRPLRPLTILRAVDPLEDAGGVGVAQIFAVKEENLGAFCQKAEAAFEQYVQTGVREAGLLVTLDAPNNFPRLPYRTDGPYLVWLGIVKDNEILEGGFQPLAEHSLESLSAGDFLRQPPEQIFLDPTNRSRLRWLD